MAPGRDVNVSTVRLKPIRRDAELRGAASDVAKGRTYALLHHVAELAGEDERWLFGGSPGYPRRLDFDDVAPGLRHGESVGNPGLVMALLFRAFKPQRTEERGKVFAAHVNGRRRAAVGRLGLSNPTGNFPTDRRDLTVKVSDAGLTCVPTDD